MASSSVNHSVPASSRSCKHDVFLSFRGEDTRKTFVDHLYSALQQHLILTYKDDQTLRQGESISPALFKAIEDSRIAVIIFSENYANSSWCLEELAHIVKCKDERHLIVIPIFYDVEPTEVRNQKGKFGEGFTKQEAKNITKVDLWRKALVDMSNIAGWEQKNIANGHESQFIKRIVDTVLDRLFTSQPSVDEDLVGLRARMQDLESLLDIESSRVHMVGIWGVGGSGKTTLATSLKKKISKHFHDHCTLENVREETRKHGLKKLQENILSIFKTEVTVQSVEEGKDMIKHMLCSRKVLLLLDDVDTLEELEALAGKRNWFGSGSRIIITTRDEHLLKIHKVDEIYNVKLFSDDEAIMLFNKHAYNENACVEDYEALSLRVVAYTSGLPLALKVLGSFLYDKEKKGWMGTLDRLKDTPEMEIVEKLKISYDGLKTMEKELFLDIACFWRGRRKDDAMETLEACGYHPGIGIEVLRQKALITVSRYGHFDMHDLVQEMGHYVVSGEHPNNPEKHSRLWKLEEIKSICSSVATMVKSKLTSFLNYTLFYKCNALGSTHTLFPTLLHENDTVEAIEFDADKFRDGIDRTSRLCKLISNMRKLRYLNLSMIYPMKKKMYPMMGMRSPKNVEGPESLSNELRYIIWKRYPARSPFPGSFQPMKLVVLKLHDNFQKILWKGFKHLPHLKVLQLKYMTKLLSTPNFDGLPRLQKLTLFRCNELREIHPSLGKHTSLQHVRVSRCPKLRLFPTIVHMENLETLKITGCRKILEFPDIRAKMESLLKLSLHRIGISILPSSIGECCTNLTTLNLSSLYNIRSIEINWGSLKHLKKLRLQKSKQRNKTRHQVFHKFVRRLRELDFSARRFKDLEIHSAFLELSNLQDLSLSGNGFLRLDVSLAQLTQLKVLNLWGCEKLIELPELPSSLTTLVANNCKSLTTFGRCYINCTQLCHVTLVGGSIVSDGDKLLETMLEMCMNSENRNMLLALEGFVVAKRFIPRICAGKRWRMELPENWCNDFSGFLMCVVLPRFNSFVWITMKEMVTSGVDVQNDVVWEESDSHTTDSDSDGDGDKDMTWVGYVSFASLIDTTWWKPTHKALDFNVNNNSCSGFGVRLVEKKSSRSCLEETSTYSSSSSHYAPKLKIANDLESALTMTIAPYKRIPAVFGGGYVYAI